jgi:glycine oxidase
MAEFVIVGAGLAGTTLAWALHRRGRAFRLIDREPPTTASRIAAGLLTPITGKKPAVSWRWHELRPFAEGFYRQVEVTTGVECFHPRPVVRLFTSAKEREAFINPGFSVHTVVGEECVVMPTAARLDTAAYLNASREHFAKLGLYERGEWDGKVSDAVTVLCQGYVSGDPFDLPFRPAKGEILTVRIPDAPDDRVFNRGGWWLAPTTTRSAGVPPAFESGRDARAPSDTFRFGATYSWDQLDDIPSETGREELASKLRELIRKPFEIVGHDAGVRPIVAGRKPVIGLHPTDPRLAVFNGLSSKGALTAPYFADMLAAHLCDGIPIDPEVDVRNRTHP